MEWLLQNWLWLVLLVGAYFMMSRMGMSCCGVSHSHDHGRASGGLGSGAHGDSDEKGMGAVKLVDPVSQ